jgi:hypothetical protein
MSKSASSPMKNFRKAFIITLHDTFNNNLQSNKILVKIEKGEFKFD